MGRLEELENFVCIVDSGGISKASDQQNIAKSAVSRRLSDLEARLGCTLFYRTTRKMTLTEAGQTCYQKAVKLLSQEAEIYSGLNTPDALLTGHLKLSAPLSFGVKHLPVAIHSFSQKFPKLKLDIQLSDHLVDLVENGFDVAIRIGQLADSSLKARRLFKVRLKIVASPEFIKKHGKPTQVDDLTEYPWVKYTAASRSLRIKSPNGIEHELNTKHQISANNGDLLNELAILGQGLVISPNFICDQYLQSNSLIELLPDHEFANIYAYAVFPNSQFIPEKVKKLTDFLAAHFAEKFTH